jgi:hypothetical protein
VSARAGDRGRLVTAPGAAAPPAEPRVRARAAAGRRVGATLPTEAFVSFKAFVARRGTTGEAVIIEALERLIGAG